MGSSSPPNTPSASSSLQRRRRLLLEDDESTSTSYNPISSEDEGVDNMEETLYNDSVVEDTPIEKSSAIQRRKRSLKTEDDDIPLPDPFPIPKNFRMDVDVSLKSGKMNRQTKSAFFSSIASAILHHKKYPTKEDYICVARSIIAKYPFLKSPAGSPYVSVYVCRTF